MSELSKIDRAEMESAVERTWRTGDTFHYKDDLQAGDIEGRPGYRRSPLDDSDLSDQSLSDQLDVHQIHEFARLAGVSVHINELHSQGGSLVTFSGTVHSMSELLCVYAQVRPELAATEITRMLAAKPDIKSGQEVKA